MATNPSPNPFDQFDQIDAAGTNPFDQFDTPEPPATLIDKAKQVVADEKPYFLSAGIRPVAKAAFALPNMVGDAATAVFNYGRRGYELATGQQPTPYAELPSAGFARALDKYTTAPTSTAGKVGEGINTAIVGAMLPTPKVQVKGAGGQPVPENFRGVTSQKQATLENGRGEGYVVPPSTVSSSAKAKIAEGTAGKITTAQQAAARNQSVTDKLAAEAVGLPVGESITPTALEQVRKEAGKAYEAVASLPGKAAVQADSLSNVKGAPAVDPRQMIEDLKQARFDASAWEKSYARTADPDSLKKGKAAGALATRLESQLEDYAKSLGRGDLVPELRKARALIAKTWTVENALNEGTGSVNAAKLARDLANGAPLSGGLRKAAMMAEAFPKATRMFNESLPGVSPIDAYGSGGMAAVTKEPLYLLYPFARMGIRNALLSDTAQNTLVGQGPQMSPRVLNSLATVRQ